MNKTLSSIKKKMGNIQFGLLRFQEKNRQMTLQVKVAENEGTLLSCMLTDVAPQKKMLTKHVSLIQKCHDDYLYIAGMIVDEMQMSRKILTVQITKACWFVKKSKGNVSWLQQKYIYESLQKEIPPGASHEKAA